MRNLYVLAVVTCFMSVGCGVAPKVIMYNPETKDVKECSVDYWNNWPWEEERVIQACVEQYKKIEYIEANKVKPKEEQKNNYPPF